MIEVRFFIPGQPVGKGRPRATSTRAGIRMFTPEKTASYEGLVSHAAHVAMAGRALILGAVRLELDIALTIPASMSKTRQSLAANGCIYPKTKPDIDNVEKAISDALNGVVWRDDVQVVDVVKRKRYGATPGVGVWVQALESEV